MSTPMGYDYDDLDYNAPGNRSGLTKAAAICLMVLTTIVVVLRFWARHIATRAGLWWDDWLALAAWVFAIIEFSFAFPLTANGEGQHIGHVTPQQMSRALFFIYVQQFFYNFSLTFMKLSVLMFYIRVFSWKIKWFRYAIWITGFFVVAWCIYTNFLGAFQCIPVRRAWIPDLPGHCVYQIGIFIGAAAPNIVIDIMILLIPLPILKGLHTTREQKIGLVLIFVIGYCVPIVSIVRTIQVSLLDPARLKDFTWYTNPTAILLYVEPGVGLISICLPTDFYLLLAAIQGVRHFSWFSFKQSLSSNEKDRAKLVNAPGPPHLPHLPNRNVFAPGSQYTANIWSENASNTTSQ